MADEDLEGNFEYDTSIPVGDSASDDSEGEIQDLAGVLDGKESDAKQPAKTVNAKKRAKLQALRAKKKQKAAVVGEFRLLPLDEQCAGLWEMYLSALAPLGLKLTPVETEDRKAAFTLTRFVGLPQNRSPENFRQYLKSLRGPSQSPVESTGSPAIVIITYSATRAVAFVKGLKGVKPPLKLAKLFSRHLKVEEQRKELMQGCDIAIGTPNRMLKLIGTGSLSLASSLCVVDACKDVKQNTIFDMSGVREDFFRLFHEHIAPNPLARICLF